MKAPEFETLVSQARKVFEDNPVYRDKYETTAMSPEIAALTVIKPLSVKTRLAVFAEAVSKNMPTRTAIDSSTAQDLLEEALTVMISVQLLHDADLKKEWYRRRGL